MVIKFFIILAAIILLWCSMMIFLIKIGSKDRKSHRHNPPSPSKNSEKMEEGDENLTKSEEGRG